MIDIILFFFLFMPLLNMIRGAKINDLAKLLIIVGAIGLFSAWCAKEVTGKFISSYSNASSSSRSFTRTIIEKPLNYYEMIGIGAREPIVESKIKKLFRKKSLLYHPDKVKQMNPNASDADMEEAQ